MRKPAFRICENKDADQLRGNREADQRLCFRYIDSTITLLPKSEGARWPGGLCLGLRIQRSGVRAPLGSNRVVSLSKAHLLPKKYW